MFPPVGRILTLPAASSGPSRSGIEIHLEPESVTRAEIICAPSRIQSYISDSKMLKQENHFYILVVSESSKNLLNISNIEISVGASSTINKPKILGDSNHKT